MALTGLEIFKLLPKTNCKKCGMPTCLAFAMQLAQKRAKLEDCPDVSEEAKKALAAAAEPPMRKVVFGAGDNQVQIGAETVCFRHEEKFHNPTVLAASVSDKLAGQDLTKRIESVKQLSFERVGTQLSVSAIAVINDSGSADTFAKVASTAAAQSGLALILVTESPEAMAAAVGQIANRPLIGCACVDTAEAMAKIAKEADCPLVAKAESIEQLAELTEKIKAEGVEDIVLCPQARQIANGDKRLAIRNLLYDLSRMRYLALKKVFRPLGYPTITRLSSLVPLLPQGQACPRESGDDSVSEGPATGDQRRGTRDDMQAAMAISLICKYSSIVVVDSIEPYAFLPMLTSVMNIFSDPQKPVQVEPKVYPIGEPDTDSPLMFTTNFSLTYYTVASDVERSLVPSHILVVDTEGTSVLTAYSGDKLNEKTVADAMAKYDVEKLVKHRKLIIPGYVAVMSGKLEEATNWEIMVGPRECSMLPKYLHEVWK